MTLPPLRAERRSPQEHRFWDCLEAKRSKLEMDLFHKETMKMKHMKRFVALFAALALVLAMAAPAFADEGAGTGAETTTGTITINNAVSGVTYKFYRIMEIESHTRDNPYTGVVYKTNTTWDAFVKDSQWNNYFTVNEDGTIFVKPETATDKNFSAKFAEEAAKVVSGKAPDYSKQADGSAIKETVRLGYYLVVPEGWADVNPVTCSLGTTNPDVIINEKNSDTTTEKKIMENGDPKSTNSASIGDTVNYKTTITVKDGDPKNYVLHDKMTGLDFNADSVKITVTNGSTSKELTATTDYEVKTPADGCTFHIEFKTNALKPNDIVEVTYSAKVAASAAIGDSGNKNETHLDYGEGKHTTTSETETYVWEVNIHKYTAPTENADIPLAGAKFIIYRGNDDAREYAVIADGKISAWKQERNAATELTTPNTGNLSVKGLDAGEYYLEETEAPKGYNKLKDAIKFTIADENAPVKGQVSYDTDSTGTIKVLNNAGTTLPTTGGIGTTIFYLIGGGLMVAAAVLLIAKKRMENK